MFASASTSIGVGDASYRSTRIIELRHVGYLAAVSEDVWTFQGVSKRLKHLVAHSPVSQNFNSLRSPQVEDSGLVYRSHPSQAD